MFDNMGVKKWKWYNKPRKLGLWEGKVWIAPDFDDYLPEEFIKAFKEGAD